jgi:ribosomal protein L40E
MATLFCRYCGSNNLATKEIEIRRINVLNMSISSRQQVTEFECRRCGWTDTADMRPAVAAFG